MVKISQFFMCFDIFYELNDFSANFRKRFVGAHRGVTRPYKSICRGGPGHHPPLKIDL
jgi:hypothetical protein